VRLEDLEAVIGALEDAEVRYLVVGGVAVNAHGYPRATRDLDLVLALTPENVRVALAALKALEYRPMVPVAIEEFADEGKRREWHEDRNMEVFALFSDRFPRTPVDLFVDEPFDFEEALADSVTGELAPGLRIRLAGIATLIRMKEAAGRPRDRDDVEHLRGLADLHGDTVDG
jgi:hypothetical protein